jgi:hypothetical protein
MWQHIHFGTKVWVQCDRKRDTHKLENKLDHQDPPPHSCRGALPGQLHDRLCQSLHPSMHASATLRVTPSKSGYNCKVDFGPHSPQSRL